MWWTIVFLCLTYFSAGVALDIAPSQVSARIIAWRDTTALQTSCRLAFLASHINADTTNLG
jgi:hypothetical protein